MRRLPILIYCRELTVLGGEHPNGTILVPMNEACEYNHYQYLKLHALLMRMAALAFTFILSNLRSMLRKFQHVTRV